jgi:2-phospho-L-lactate/phosphoenolpyruvate guanylyltransferase
MESIIRRIASRRMRTAAVLPVKRFDSAKQRLGDAVGGAERRELAAAMVEDVLAALREIDGLDDLIVVTAEDRAAALARAVGAHVVADRVEGGQSLAAEVGVETALQRGAERALLVPGDCPALDPHEVDTLLRNHKGGVTIVPDRHGEGTNALLLTPPKALSPAFGPGSMARHAALARAGGATVRVAQAPSLELDVDTPGDLAALRAALDERPGVAPRTRAVLERLAALSAR